MIKGDVDAQYIQAPATPLLFPPAGWFDTYRVGSHDRWIDIAESFGVGGWDLIEFNFGTRDEKVYNHCMKHLLGCTYTTDDRKRYSFYDASPGLIFIPPKGWKPYGTGEVSAEEQALRDEVVKLLGSSYVRMVRFQNPALNQTTPGMLSNVASLIGRNKIRVTRDLGAKAHEYDPHGNAIILAGDDTTGVLSQGTIVHECVHAAQDAQNRPMMQVNAECDAYIAQMIYLKRAGVIGLPPVWVPAIDVNDPNATAKTKYNNWVKSKGRAVYKEACRIAERVIATHTLNEGNNTYGVPVYERNSLWDNIPVVPDADYNLLKLAVAAHPLYEGSDSRFAELNGV